MIQCNGDTFIYGVRGDFIDGDARFEAVPEPTSEGFLLALGTIAMLRRKRD